MSWGNIYNADVSKALSGDVLATVQGAIETKYAIDTSHYPMIGVCDMRAADAFTVTFNAENTMTSVKMPSGEYGVTYKGGIDQITFAASTTLTWFQVQWAYAGVTK